MGPLAFNGYLASIQGHIGNLIDTAKYLEILANTLTNRVADGDLDDQNSVGMLERTQGELAQTHTKISALKDFFVNVVTKWSKAKNRVIGHVVWAPGTGAAGLPHRYTRDLCVIKLDKEKFKNFRGNVLSLGKY
jgi:hypothetical protein